MSPETTSPRKATSRIEPCLRCGGKGQWKRQKRPWQLECIDCGRRTAEHQLPSDAVLDWNGVYQHVPRMRLSAACKLWWHEGEVVNIRSNGIDLIEPLNTTARPSDSPYCWGVGDITFRDQRDRKTDEVRSHGLLCAVPQFVFVDRVGAWFEVTGGACRFVRGQWCMLWHARRNTRLAYMMNDGFAAYKNFEYSRRWLRWKRRVRFLWPNIRHRLRAWWVRYSDWRFHRRKKREVNA